mmetsp:Transcript_46440/g.123208  ORF Transcript_46440/g.123208 Transcript_46440/m.123208 type:complete len:207 (-) Transcript_46440:165-785(-)
MNYSLMQTQYAVGGCWRGGGVGSPISEVALSWGHDNSGPSNFGDENLSVHHEPYSTREPTAIVEYRDSYGSDPSEDNDHHCNAAVAVQECCQQQSHTNKRRKVAEYNLEDLDEKRRDKVLKNRISAGVSRLRQRQRTVELEAEVRESREQVRTLHELLAHCRERAAALLEENRALKARSAELSQLMISAAPHPHTANRDASQSWLP